MEGKAIFVFAQQYAVAPLRKILEGRIDPSYSSFSLPKANRMLKEVERQVAGTVMGVYRRILYFPEDTEFQAEEMEKGKYDLKIARSRPMIANGSVQGELVQVGYGLAGNPEFAVKLLGKDKRRVNVKDYREITANNTELREYMVYVSEVWKKVFEDNIPESEILGFDAFFIESALKVCKTNGLEREVYESIQKHFN